MHKQCIKSYKNTKQQNVGKTDKNQFVCNQQAFCPHKNLLFVGKNVEISIKS